MKTLLFGLTLLASMSSFAGLTKNVNCEVKLSATGLGSISTYALEGAELSIADEVEYNTFKIKSGSELILTTTEEVIIKAIPRVYEYETTSQLMVVVRVEEAGKQTGFGSFTTSLNSFVYKTGEALNAQGQYHVKNRNSAYPSILVKCGVKL